MNLRKKAIIVGILIIVAYSMLLTLLVSPFLGLLLEVISGLAVIAISILMYPLFISKGKALTKSYLVGKFVEGGLMLAAGVMILIGNIIMYDNLYAVHTYIFAISAILFYLLLYKSKFVPRFISIWGIIAGILLIGVNLLDVMGVSISLIIGIIGYAPIILNEVFLALWFIFRGFNLKTKKK